MKKSKLEELYKIISEKECILDEESKQLEEILTEELSKIEEFENDSDESAVNTLLNGKDILTISQLKWLVSLLIRAENNFCPKYEKTTTTINE